MVKREEKEKKRANGDDGESNKRGDISPEGVKVRGYLRGDSLQNLNNKRQNRLQIGLAGTKKQKNLLI